MKKSIMVLMVIWGCTIATAPEKPGPPREGMKLLWEIPYEFIGTAVTSTPLLLGDSLVIMTAGRELLGIEQSTGAIRWKSFVSDLTNLQTNEFRTDGRLLFATHVEDVRAYDVRDGSLVWKQVLPEERGAFFAHTIDYYQGLLFVPGYYTIYAFDAETGRLRWQKEPRPKKAIYGITVAMENLIFGGNYSEKDQRGNPIELIAQVGALNPVSGDSIWTTTLQGNGGVVMPPVAAGNLVYAGTAYTYPSSFDAFDIITGESKWSYYTPNEYWHYDYAIVVGDKVIANAGPYHVAAFDKHTGQLLWRTFIVQDANAGKLHYYNGYVYHPHGIRIRILDPETGKVVYTLNGANGNRLYTMAIGNGKLFVQGWPYLQCYEAYK